MEIVWSLHALAEADRRNIDLQDVERILVQPGQVHTVRPGRQVWQGILASGHLLRVFVDIDRNPWEIVTVYRTSKVGKYWRP